MKNKKNIKEPLQTSNSTICMTYDSCIEVYYKDQQEMLDNIDGEIEILYPLFCKIFNNFQNMQSNIKYKEEFKERIIEALELILQDENKNGKIYVFYVRNHHTFDEDSYFWYYPTIFFMKDGDLEKDSRRFECEPIIKQLLFDETTPTESWVNLLNKLTSLDNRPKKLKKIYSRSYKWNDLGYDFRRSLNSWLRRGRR